MYLNKKEACNVLGIGERSLGKLATQGKLSVHYIRGKNGRVAQYLESEVIKLKEEREQLLVRPVIDNSSNSLETSPAIVNNSSFVAVQEAIVATLQDASFLISNELRQANLTDKLLLTVDEVKALTGLSRNIIIDEIKGNKLKAKKIGRSWRIKRLDLEEYIKKL